MSKRAPGTPTLVSDADADHCLSIARMIGSMQNLLWFLLAAACEIAGCYTAWLWLRLGRSPWWIVPGTITLLLFAFALTRVDAAFAGRAFAAYGGIYIASSLLWMAVVERTMPRITDYLGAAICLAGAALILYGPRWSGA